MTPEDFIAAILPYAQAGAVKSRIPASFTIAEGALESAWGNSQLAREAMNLFGVKADRSWTGPIYTLRTREYLNGQWTIVPANWRRYSDWQGCIDDHAAFLLSNPRFRIAFGRNYDGHSFTLAISAAGYATDPGYANKICSIIQAHNLMQYDVVPSNPLKDIS